MIFLLGVILAIILVVDLKTQKIPDGLTCLGIILSLGMHITLGSWLFSLIGIVGSILLVFLLNLTPYYRLGGGDAKLLAMIGAFWGLGLSSIVLLISLIISRPISYYRRQEGYRYTVFSPFIIIGLIGALLIW